MVKSGARLTIFLTVPLTILECILKDQTTMTQIIGHVYSDLIKVGISSLIAAIAGIAVGSVVTFAAAPIIVAIAVGVVAGLALEAIDKHYGLTDKLVAAMEEVQRLSKYNQYRGQEEQLKGNHLLSTMRFQ
jgi:uncharacterized membrane protein